MKLDEVFLNENFNRGIVSSSYIDDLVSKIHTREEDFIEGDLMDRIYKYDTYIYDEININRLNLDEFSLDDEWIDELAEEIKRGKQIYPIVYDPQDRSIIDGNHRANAYNQAGLTVIPAYIGHELAKG